MPRPEPTKTASIGGRITPPLLRDIERERRIMGMSKSAYLERALREQVARDKRERREDTA